ncbi:MAG: hypothetical protein J6V44_12290 [Methanobrevibacter sp.]|nr:hypothetical protein [Methanobrevibacter sp.]
MLEDEQRVLTRNIELQSLQDVYGTPFIRADLDQIEEIFFQIHRDSTLLNPTGDLNEQQQREMAINIAELTKMQAILDESARTLQAYYEGLKATDTVDTYNKE